MINKEIIGELINSKKFIDILKQDNILVIRKKLFNFFEENNIKINYNIIGISVNKNNDYIGVIIILDDNIKNINLTLNNDSNLFFNSKIDISLFIYYIYYNKRLNILNTSIKKLNSIV